MVLKIGNILSTSKSSIDEFKLSSNKKNSCYTGKDLHLHQDHEGRVSGNTIVNLNKIIRKLSKIFWAINCFGQDMDNETLRYRQRCFSRCHLMFDGRR